MGISREFCFVCNKPFFYSNRKHLEDHLQKNHQEIFKINREENLNLGDIVSFPGISCGLVKVQFAFPLKIEGRRATLVLGHRICQKMDCSTKWVDAEGNLFFEWTLLFDHNRKEDMHILELWPTDNNSRKLLKKDQPTMICSHHLPPNIRTQLLETGSLPPVPANKIDQEAYWQFPKSHSLGKKRNTVTKQFFKNYDIFQLFKKPMRTMKASCMPGKRKKSVNNVGPFVVKRNSFKIKVFLSDPVVQLERGICDSKYKCQMSAATAKKAELEFKKWEEEQKKITKDPVFYPDSDPDSDPQSENEQQPEQHPDPETEQYPITEANTFSQLQLPLNSNFQTLPVSPIPAPNGCFFPGPPLGSEERQIMLEANMWDSNNKKTSGPVGTFNYSVNLPFNWMLTSGGCNQVSHFSVTSASRENVDIKCLETSEFPVNQLVLSLVAFNKDRSKRRDLYIEHFQVAAPLTDSPRSDSPISEIVKPQQAATDGKKQQTKAKKRKAAADEYKPIQSTSQTFPAKRRMCKEQKN